jgi:hypothetical protein
MGLIALESESCEAQQPPHSPSEVHTSQLHSQVKEEQIGAEKH